jgi:hypothetical protein
MIDVLRAAGSGASGGPPVVGGYAPHGDHDASRASQFIAAGQPRTAVITD